MRITISFIQISVRNGFKKIERQSLTWCFARQMGNNQFASSAGGVGPKLGRALYGLRLDMRTAASCDTES